MKWFKTEGTIYCLIDPITAEIKYVGKTSMPLMVRIHSHATARLNSRARVTEWLVSLSQMPAIGILETLGYDGSYEAKARLAQREVYWIEYLTTCGFDLVNSEYNHL